MANLTKIAVLLAGALSLLSLIVTVESKVSPHFLVEGQVYCEICRINFINKLSQPMPDATVRLQCRGEEKGNITYSIEGKTDAHGRYSLKAEGDHEDEECEVTLVKSSRPDCAEIPNEGWALEPSSKITITDNNGFHGKIRQANPLGFTTKKRGEGCPKLFKELQIDPNHLV